KKVLSCLPPPALGALELFSATPGASWNVPVKVRVSGSFSIVSFGVTTVISDAFVSTSGSAAVTSTDSRAVARRTGRTSVVVTSATTTSWSKTPIPESSAFRWYLPGGRSRNRKAPSASVVDERPLGICGPVMVTVAPGRGAPEPSTTTPEISPVVWANARGAAKAQHARSTAKTLKRIFLTPSHARGAAPREIENSLEPKRDLHTLLTDVFGADSTLLPAE